MNARSLFEQWMFEAPGDDPPDAQLAEENTPPDVPEEVPDTDPPDIEGGDDPDTDMPADDGPPDLSDDSFGDDDFGGTDEGSGDDVKDMGLDDKVSSVLNYNLYQSYLELLTQIRSTISSIKNNSDILYAISKDTEGVVNALRDLDENIRLYIDNSYTNERYEKNLLFYNKCKNLAKLLNDKFDAVIKKGLKES